MADPRPAVNYEHRQRATWLLVLVGLGALAAGIGAALLAERSPAAGGILAATVLLLAAVAWQFHLLTVRVGGGEVTVAFGSGWIARRTPLAQVRDVRCVRNAWWNGWGIRWIPRGWLWNVAGLSAVELDLPGERRLRIGTDEPEALAAAIRSAMAS